MKRILSLLLCLCLMQAFLAVVFAAPEDEEPYSNDIPIEDVETEAEPEYEVEDPADIEEYYDEISTIYDLDNEDDTLPVPDEEEPEAPPDDGDGDEEIYEDDSYDAEIAGQLDGAEYVLDEILIKFKEPWQVPGKEKQLQREIAQLERIGFVEGLGVYVIKVADLTRDPNAIFNRYKNNKYIEYVEPNYIMKPDLIPNDPNYSAMALALTILGAQAGWDIISGGSGPIVAVVDSGVANHPDLPPLLPGYSSVAGLSPNNDKANHGTGVAGAIGAIGNNKLGGMGINWNASILPVKVDDAAGAISVANVAKGIMWAADNGAKIINLSLGTNSDSATFKNAIDYAYNKGCAIFASAGNNGTNGLMYPARYPNVMAVGGSGNGSTRAAVSNYGAGMGVLANTSYNTTAASGGFSVMSGTSFSSPQVAGLASLILALNPSLTNAQVYDLIRQGAKGNGVYQNDEVGYGFINIQKTLQLAQATLGSGPPPPPADTIPPVLTLSGSTTMTINQGTPFVEPGYSATDNVDGNITNKVIITGSVNINIVGTYTLTYSVSDTAGNSASATRTVTVRDVTPPVITLVGAASMQINQGTAFVEPGYTAIDNVDGNITNRVVVTGTVNSNTPGTYTRTYTVSDTAGNSASATRTVIVSLVDTTPPVITLTGGASMQISQGTAWVEPGYTAIDNVDGDITNRVTITGSVNTNTPGVYNLTYRVSDNAGNTATAIRSVTVILVDTTPPVITLAGGTSMQINQGTTWVEPGYTAIDNVDGNITNRVTVTGSVNTNTVGTYTLTYRVSDTAGNTATATRTVQVLYVDRTPPVLTLLGAATMKIDEGQPYVEPGYTAIDNIDGNITGRVIVTGSVAINVPGVYILTYTVSDNAGNTSTASRTVTVIAAPIIVPPETPQEPPRTPPVITLTGFTTMTLEYGQAYIENGFTAVDCTGVVITSSVNVTGSVDHWKAGLYTITYEVSDLVNPMLTARATRTVIVSPKPPDPPPPTAPKITINGSNPIILHRDSATPYTEQMARAVDHNGNDVSNLVTVTGWSAANRRIANSYTLTYRITSPTTGLTSTATRVVRIVAPNEKREPRVTYNFNGQAKAGAKVTHTGVLASTLGFMDLSVTSIDKNMTITVQLIDTATKKAVLTDSFSAAGTKQYKINAGRYDLVVAIDKANGNSKYSVRLLMPETLPVYFYDVAEVPLPCCPHTMWPHIAPIGSNPIILHIGGTPYFEQGARATDYLGNPIEYFIIGEPDTSLAGTYTITYAAFCTCEDPATMTATREVQVYDPSDETSILPDEVPLDEYPPVATEQYTVVAGDSLWRISQKYYGTGVRWGEIYELNKDVIGANPGMLRIGLVLIIMLE